jgi:hypothetical protein
MNKTINKKNYTFFYLFIAYNKRNNDLWRFYKLFIHILIINKVRLLLTLFYLKINNDVSGLRF